MEWQVDGLKRKLESAQMQMQQEAAGTRGRHTQTMQAQT